MPFVPEIPSINQKYLPLIYKIPSHRMLESKQDSVNLVVSSCKVSISLKWFLIYNILTSLRSLWELLEVLVMWGMVKYFDILHSLYANMTHSLKNRKASRKGKILAACIYARDCNCQAVCGGFDKYIARWRQNNDQF